MSDDPVPGSTSDLGCNNYYCNRFMVVVSSSNAILRLPERFALTNDCWLLKNRSELENTGVMYG
jgi:hypothetical protein